MEANRARTRIHRLPTEESHILKDNGHREVKLTYYTQLCKTMGWVECQHLYFTTDEEIKEGDKILWEGKIYDYLEFMSMKTSVYTDYEKIIASTDPKLTAKEIIKVGDKVHSERQDFNDQVVHTEKSAELYNKSDHYFKKSPQPSRDFIKAYCEQGGFDWVDVEVVVTPNESNGDIVSIEGKDKVVSNIALSKLDNLWWFIDQDGLMNMCETTTTIKVDSHNTITTHRIVEKMYSREGVIVLINKHRKETYNGYSSSKWIKENL